MDIDIDFRTDFDPLNLFPNAVRASMVKTEQLVKHPAGVYFQTMPKDILTSLAAIPYSEAEELGFTKIDFLHLSFLDNFENKNEIRVLLKTEPDWFLLESAEVVKKLFQLHKHFDLVSQVKPRSVIELADCVALIRPFKRKLLNVYLKERNVIRDNFLYKREEGDKTSFKKCHAIAYALTIVLQLHLIKAKIL